MVGKNEVCYNNPNRYREKIKIKYAGGPYRMSDGLQLWSVDEWGFEQTSMTG